MNRLYLTLLLFFLTVTVNAQKQSMKVLSNKSVPGINHIAKEDINATEHYFPESVYEVHVDTLSGLLSIQLRGSSRNGKWLDNKGKLLIYDPKEHLVKWERKISYLNTKILQSGNIIISNKGNKSSRINLYNGLDQFEMNGNIFYINAQSNIGIGYRIPLDPAAAPGTIEGRSLLTGELLWKKKLKLDYGLNDIIQLDDSTVLISAAGLNTVNMNTGSGWSYSARTGEKDYTATALVNAGGMALGFLTGTFITATGHKLVSDLVSNVLIDSTYIYLASGENISSINKRNGEVRWTCRFPDNMAGKSVIFLKDNFIIMVNSGYAFMGYRKLDYGTPFIAIFDKETGKQIVFATINTLKDPILGYHLNGDDLLVLFKERISKFSISKRDLYYERAFKSDEYGELSDFTGDHLFTGINDSVFKNLVKSDTSKTFVITSAGKILELDSELNITRKFNSEDIYLSYLKTDGYTFIEKDNKTIILDSDNIKIAEFAANIKSSLLGNTIYNVKEQCIQEIDLSGILGER